MRIQFKLFCIIGSQSQQHEASSHAWKDVDAYPEMVTLKTMIMHDKLTTIVFTRMMSKHYGIMYNKRVVNDNLSTIPFGY